METRPRVANEIRLELVKALLNARTLLPDIIEIVESCATRDEAVDALGKSPFNLDEFQAQHVLDLRIADLLDGRQDELRQERDALVAALDTGPTAGQDD